MRIASVLIILVAVGTGCSRFGADSGTTGNKGANTNSSAKTVKKLVDLPSLLGKSVDEMNTILGQKGTEKMGTVTYDIPNGSVYAHVAKKDSKYTVLTFTFKEQTIDGIKFRGYNTSKEIEQTVGLELTGTPEKSEYEEKYKDFMISGKKCEVTVKKMLEAYTGVELLCL